MEASAPGKFILFGEHAVVYGHPAIALAVDLRLTASFEPGGEPRLDGDADAAVDNPYVEHAMSRAPSTGDVRIDSAIPRAVGLGSSAALCVALAGAIFDLDDETAIAERAFELERGAQGKGSPIDTSTATHGAGVLVAPDEREERLWTLSAGDQTWHIHHADVPDLHFVVGDTGVARRTGRMVTQVAVRTTADPAARQAMNAIGQITRRGMEALADGDPVRIGNLMDQNQKMLARVGVNTDELQTLIEAARPHAFGAKLTGAGGGGSMIALTDDPDSCAEAIAEAGGTPYVVSTTETGVRLG